MLGNWIHVLCWLEKMQSVCISNGCAKQLAFHLGGNEDGLVSRENSRCGLPFLVATVVIAAKTRRRNSRVLQLAEGGLCSVLSIAAKCECVHVLLWWPLLCRSSPRQKVVGHSEIRNGLLFELVSWAIRAWGTRSGFPDTSLHFILTCSKPQQKLKCFNVCRCS